MAKLKVKTVEKIPRRVQEAAPLLAEIFVDFEPEQNIFEINQKVVTRSSSILGNFNKYLGRFDDSWILETTIEADKFSITLNDFTTRVFAEALVRKKKLKIDDNNLVFPIRIDFNIAKLSYNLVDELGNIKKIRTCLKMLNHPAYVG